MKVGSPNFEILFSYCASLQETTVFLYTLDTLPLVLAIVPYIPFWPAKYIEHDEGKSAESLEMNTALPP